METIEVRRSDVTASEWGADRATQIQHALLYRYCTAASNGGSICYRQLKVSFVV